MKKDLSKRLASLISGRTVKGSEYRPDREELVVRFADGTRMYVDNHTGHLDISVESSSEKTREGGVGPYCCFRFRESVQVDKTIIKARRHDETEWHLPSGGHIYFCPFCGRKVKGKGFGTYKQAALSVEEALALKTQTASRAATAIAPRQVKKTKDA